jgi:uncharacterized beta-barrel protein YwiB (DUF1934 family)
MSDLHQAENESTQNNVSVNPHDSTAWDDASAENQTAYADVPMLGIKTIQDVQGSIVGYDIKFKDGPQILFSPLGATQDILIKHQNEYDPELLSYWGGNNYDYQLGYNGVISNTECRTIQSMDDRTHLIISKGGARVAHRVEEGDIEGAQPDFSLTKLMFGQNVTTVSSVNENNQNMIKFKYETPYSEQIVCFVGQELAFTHTHTKLQKDATLTL